MVDIVVIAEIPRWREEEFRVILATLVNLIYKTPTQKAKTHECLIPVNGS